MMIVVTGVDKTGKTTLSNKLASLLSAKYLHFSKPPVDAVDYFSMVFSAPVDRLIVDRWAEGDAIYAEAMGHEKRLTKEEYLGLLTVGAERGMMYVVCWDQDEAVAHRFRTEGEDFVPVDKISTLQRLFLREARWLASLKLFPVVLMNNFTNSYEVLCHGNQDGSGIQLPKAVPATLHWFSEGKD